MKSLKDAVEMVLECFDNDYGQIAKDFALADLRRAFSDTIFDWNGLNEAEIDECYESDNPVETAEDKLREKNT